MRKLPTRFYVIEKRDAGTIALRNKQTGRFKGRRRTGGTGDMTGVRRITKNIDIDGDGRKDDTGGWIMGRTTRVKASNKSKGHLRSI